MKVKFIALHKGYLIFSRPYNAVDVSALFPNAFVVIAVAIILFPFMIDVVQITSVFRAIIYDISISFDISNPDFTLTVL